MGAFGRVKNAGLGPEDWVLKQRETQEHKRPHFEAVQEKEGPAQLAQNREHIRRLKPASHVQADLGDWDKVTKGWAKVGWREAQS